MTTNGRMEAGEALLRDRGADNMEHPGGTLLAHLQRVSRLLAHWGADDDIQLAGLCHAAYGTDGFDVALLSLHERALLAEAVGGTAEALVYLYASCNRQHTYPQLSQSIPTFTNRFDGTWHTPPHADIRAFVEITAANEWDVLRHNEQLARRYGAELTQLLSDAGRYLSEAARTAWTPPNSAGSAP